MRLDAGLRVANDAFRRFDDDVAAQEYFSSKGYTSVEDGMLPEFDWGSIEDVPQFIQELRGYARDLKPINKQLSDSLFNAADEMVVTKAKPEVKRVFLRIPQNAPVFQAKPETIGMVMRDFSAEREPTKAGIVELPGDVVIDTRTRRVTVAGEEISLTRKEFDLLALLATDPGATQTRESILEQVWDAHWYGPTKTLDVHIASLRKKLGDPSIIETVRGVGFRLRSTDAIESGP